CQQGYNPPLTF
nr:immunoglobulin light chain junction region [Macaca mulatta]MOV84480.1 immunoglobulin light chain junction region [Macaca mulatta]